MACTTQLSFDLERHGWGGHRKRAGRKVGPRPPTPHRARPLHDAGQPVHVTLRTKRRAPYLRAERTFRLVRDAIRDASRDSFRVVHFSVQGDHVHLLVEANDAEALSSGARGLAIRIAKRMNARLGRVGPLWGDRWHGRALRTPREVRNALVYVLANWRKHERDARGPVDACSSAPWFHGWRDASPRALAALRWDAGRAPPVAPADTWLLKIGWRRRGLVSVHEAPR
jgi:REP element-mobilizing transposase RayT